MNERPEIERDAETPEGWKSGTLGSFGQFKVGSGFPTRYQGRVEGKFPFIKVSDFSHPQNKDGILTANHFIEEPTLKIIGAKVHSRGSIVFAKIGAALFLERKRQLFVDCCIDNNMMSYSVNLATGDPQFFKVLFNSIRLSDAVAASALPVLSTTDLREIQFSCPPLPEQQAIAKALGDVDGLIASLEALIAKKRDIKQGAMQELLSGHRRLPGFKGEWTSVPLRDFANADWGNTAITKASYTETGYTAYSASGPDGFVGWHEHDGKGIVISAIGAQCGKSWFVNGKWTPIKNTIWIEVGPTACTEFVQFVTSNPEFWPKSGQAQPFVSVTSVRKAIIPQPSFEEQSAIASILSAMDAEIAALEAKLSKTRDVKQGMMQVLLTGEVRLI